MLSSLLRKSNVLVVVIRKALPFVKKSCPTSGELAM